MVVTLSLTMSSEPPAILTYETKSTPDPNIYLLPTVMTSLNQKNRLLDFRFLSYGKMESLETMISLRVSIYCPRTLKDHDRSRDHRLFLKHLSSGSIHHVKHPT